MRADTGFLCVIFNRTVYSVCPGLLGVITDKSCFIVLHLVIKPANITSVGCMFKTNAFPSFYSLLLSLFFSAYPPNCCFHPCSNQLDSQVSTFSFSSNRLSLLSSIYCLHLFNKHISEMVFLWPPHFFFFHFISCLGKVYFMRKSYRWERAKKKMGSKSLLDYLIPLIPRLYND